MKKYLILLLILLLAGTYIINNSRNTVRLAGTHLSFETADIEGNPVSSEELFSRHAITMLNIWATWCGPCVSELPELTKVNEELAKMDGAVVGLLNDGPGQTNVEAGRQILAENNIRYLNILSTEAIDAVLKPQAYPMTIFVNREGIIIGETLLGTTFQDKIVAYYTEAAARALK